MQFDFQTAIDSFPRLVAGLPLTILLTVVVMLLSLPFGIGLASVRRSRYRIPRTLAYLYTELFRTTPVLLWVYLVFFAVPLQLKLSVEPFWIAVAALSMNVSAFLGEIFRASIGEVDPGQREAALSTGMTEREAHLKIVLPQAFRRSIPLVAAVWITLFKDVSIAALIGVHEVIYQARFIALESFRSIEVFTLASLLYLLLTYPQALIVNHLYDRYRVRD